MSLLEKASLIITPNGVKTGTLYAYKSTNEDGDGTWSRGSIAKRTNSSLLLEDVAIDVPRINYPLDGDCPSVLVEPQRTNLYLNSAVLVTQSVTTIANSYTVSFYGLGTVNFTGAYVGSLIGTGVNDRVYLTFATTSGSLISTVIGVCNDSQIELGEYPTTPITTTGSTVTRLKDLGSNFGTVNDFNSEEGVLFVEMRALFNDGTTRAVSISDGTTNNAIYIRYDNSANRILALVRVGSVSVATLLNSTYIVTEFNTIAVRWKLNNFSLWINGIKVGEDLNGVTIPNNTLTSLQLNTGNFSGEFKGEIKQIITFPEFLTDTEMETLTT